MNKIFNLKNALVGTLSAGVIFLTGCTKEEVVTTAGGGAKQEGEKVTLTEQQSRKVEDMYSHMTKLRYWDEANHRFIEMNPGSRDLVFTDPDEGFNFEDPDNNNVMVFTDDSGDYLILSSGFGVGVAGQGGGGTVVAGSSALNIDVTVCFSAEAIASGDGFGTLFGGDTGWSDFGAVFGIAGDFEGLANADTEAEDFNPFDYLHGFAEYFVFSDDLSGSHEVFDWMSEDAESDLDDLASSFVIDFQDFSLYFASGGTINVSGGQMNFNGTYISIQDLFDSFLEDDGFGDEEPTVDEVTGFGTMGCN